MIHRKALMISIGVTAFVVVLAGGVYNAYASSGQDSQAEMTVEDLLNDPQVQAILQEREAVYQQMLAEAQQSQDTSSVADANQVSDESFIEAGLAVALGQNALGGGTLIRNPELVSVYGRPAFELIFDRGQVYVDAVNGAILYNSRAGSQVASSSGSSHHEEDEHEEWDDD
jgi:hypothetical protein